MPQADNLGRDHWFRHARFGQMITWGPYANLGQGEQILFRGHLDQPAYIDLACNWKPAAFDATEWAKVSRDAGMKYAVLITRHHDGFCLWDSKFTDYTSARQAMQTDVVRAFVEAYRAAGLRVGLYYSLADWRIPAFWQGPNGDPEGWSQFVDYVHNQVRELLTRYGKIDLLWFDAPWPHDAKAWRSRELITMARSLQPDIIINDRLGAVDPDHADSPDLERLGHTQFLGDFATLEQHANVRKDLRPWESCDNATWQLWGYTQGERWHPTDELLDQLVDITAKGGNLLVNVGPDADGRFPQPYIERTREIGQWLETCGEAIYHSEGGQVIDTLGLARQTRRGHHLYLIVRFWKSTGRIQFAGLASKIKHATLLNTRQPLTVEQNETHTTLTGLPTESPTPLFPVIRLECDTPPIAHPWASDKLWNPPTERLIQRTTQWARARGESVWVHPPSEE